jgi:hypothetical protein
MNYKSEVENLIENLNRVAENRQKFAGYLNQVVTYIQCAEREGERASGQLFLEREVLDLQITSENLQAGRFRLMVLGDMKHGKSTLLNVLLGKQLLPSAVNPCTAILTIIRYGEQEKVTVYFKDNQQETMSFDQFTREYTIDPKEAKHFEQQQEQAFPDVSYAVVEYPLDLLQNGVEIVDSPGLNDTDERNELTLGYINSCHAILFVLNATKPCTMEERRYLENYLKGRGLTIFFLINRWDELQKSAFDPDDEREVQKYEDAQRLVFASNLKEYCIIDGSNLYEERVFETSALNALRRRVKGLPMDGTGLPEFVGSLERFLTKERAISEFRQALSLIRQTYKRLREKIELRIPLLAQDVEELRSRIKSSQPQFDKLTEIRNQFRSEIEQTQQKSAEDLADSAYRFFSNIDNTFEEDFLPYVPPLNFFKFLWTGSRKNFEEKMNEGFKKYINDKLAQWGQSAEKDLRNYGDRLALSATKYGFTYQGITDRIDANLIGVRVEIDDTIEARGDAAKSPGWARFATGATAFLLGDWVGAAGSATGTYNWRMLLGSLGIVIGTNILLSMLFGLVLGPIGIAGVMGLAGLGQAEGLRREFLKKTRELLKKELPNVAKTSARKIESQVFQLFEEYKTESISRIDDDIKSRKEELQSLLEQKENGEFKRESEIQRLNQLERDVFNQTQVLESICEDLMSDKF